MYSSDRHGGDFVNLYRLNLKDRTEERLSSAQQGQYPTSWSGPAGALIFEQGINPKTEIDLWVLPMNGGGLARPFLNEAAVESRFVLPRGAPTCGFKRATS